MKTKQQKQREALQRMKDTLAQNRALRRDNYFLTEYDDETGELYDTNIPNTRYLESIDKDIANNLKEIAHMEKILDVRLSDTQYVQDEIARGTPEHEALIRGRYRYNESYPLSEEERAVGVHAYGPGNGYD